MYCVGVGASEAHDLGGGGAVRGGAVRGGAPKKRRLAARRAVPDAPSSLNGVTSAQQGKFPNTLSSRRQGARSAGI